MVELDENCSKKKKHIFTSIWKYLNKKKLNYVLKNAYMNKMYYLTDNSLILMTF